MGVEFMSFFLERDDVDVSLIERPDLKFHVKLEASKLRPIHILNCALPFRLLRIHRFMEVALRESEQTRSHAYLRDQRQSVQLRFPPYSPKAPQHHRLYFGKGSLGGRVVGHEEQGSIMLPTTQPNSKGSGYQMVTKR